MISKLKGWGQDARAFFPLFILCAVELECLWIQTTKVQNELMLLLSTLVLPDKGASLRRT